MQLGSATAMSHRNTRSVPPPHAVPCTIAITGAGHAPIAENSPCNAPVRARGSRPGASSLMSNPAHQTAFPGAARRITARASRPARPNASVSPDSMTRPNALRRAGSFIVIVATPASMASVTGPLS